MNDELKDIVFMPKSNTLLDSLPDYLKDPANYEKVRKQLLKTYISTCGHTEMMDWAKCKKCTNKMLDRRRLLKKLGFKNARQYMAWQKTHAEIKRRYPLNDWSKNPKMPKILT